MSYTKDLSDCLGELESTSEFETDRILTHLIRFQDVANHIFQYHTRDQSLDDLRGARAAPNTERIEGLQVTLDSLWNSLSSKLKSNC